MPATADSASSTGMPAATIAPKATTRMSSVIGSDSVSARLKSFSSVSASALPTLASPNCSTRSSGWDFCSGGDGRERSLDVVLDRRLVALRP